jgi:hypothetical protein
MKEAEDYPRLYPTPGVIRSSFDKRQVCRSKYTELERLFQEETLRFPRFRNREWRVEACSMVEKYAS